MSHITLLEFIFREYIIKKGRTESFSMKNSQFLMSLYIIFPVSTCFECVLVLCYMFFTFRKQIYYGRIIIIMKNKCANYYVIRCKLILSLSLTLTVL